MPRRIDRADILTHPRRLSSGGWVYPGIIAHPGVLKYRRADGSVRRELVLPEDLHNPATLASLERAPVTLEHVPGDVVDLHNADSSAEGDVANVRPDEQGTYGEVAIRTPRGLAYIAEVRRKKGKVGLSPVYETPQYDPRPGVHPLYGEYDARQGPRIYNSVAVVANPRGVNAHLRLDSEDAYVEEGPVDPNEMKKPEGEQPAAKPEGEGAAPSEKPEGEGAAPGQKPAEGPGEMPPSDDPTSEEAAPGAPGQPPAVSAPPTLSPESLLLKESIMAEIRGLLLGHTDGMSKMILDACKPTLDSFGQHASALGGYATQLSSVFGRRADSDAAPEVAYFKSRTALEALADQMRLPADMRSDDLLAFKRNIARVARPNLRADASEEYVDGVLDALDLKPREVVRRETKTDSADVAYPDPNAWREAVNSERK